MPSLVRADATPTIRMATAPNDSAAEIYYAADMGFFKRAGLNIELSTLTNGAAISQAVAGGAIDIGGTNTVGLATAISKGVPFTALAGGGIYRSNAPTTALCVAKSSSYKTAKDLEGKVVSVPALHDMTYAGAYSWFEQNGADVTKIRFIEIPFPEAAAALERGTVDAAMMAEPALSASQHAGARFFAPALDGIAKTFMLTMWFASSDWAKKNPELFTKVQAAIYDAGRWANERKNQDRSGDILSTYTKMNRDTIRTITRSSYASSLDAKLIQPVLDAGLRFKFLDRAMSASELGAKVS
jgi:NitT/TauT family transport system substrate-binding protein